MGGGGACVPMRQQCSSNTGSCAGEQMCGALDLGRVRLAGSSGRNQRTHRQRGEPVRFKAVPKHLLKPAQKQAGCRHSRCVCLSRPPEAAAGARRLCSTCVRSAARCGAGRGRQVQAAPHREHTASSSKVLRAHRVGCPLLPLEQCTKSAAARLPPMHLCAAGTREGEARRCGASPDLEDDSGVHAWAATHLLKRPSLEVVFL
jgi:hypothetical protein